MQLHPTSRPRRVRRLIAVSAAAVAVMIAPTACDYGGAAQLDLPTHAGHHDGMDMDAPVQEHEVVPVGNTASTSPAADSAEADEDAAVTTTTAARAERRRGNDDNDGERRGRGDRPTTRPTIPNPVPAGNTSTSTTTAAATNSASASATAASTASATATATASRPPGPNNGLDVLGQRCADSKLPAHTGFQSPKAECVDIAMGEIAPENQLPSLLITGAPRFVRVGESFKLQVSTRNLVRDRFLGAAAGGYYLESSFLNDQNLQRGHFHTACRNLSSTRSAPDSSATPEFFLATQDNGGGKNADTVTITVPGIKTAGVLQCTSWAGDGSHRTPMMSRANQTPAIDSVRIFVFNGRQRGNNAAASDAVAPAVTGAGANADAAADANKQVQAEQQQAGAQAPDQDGAVQAETGAPATVEAPAEEPAVADTAEAGAGN